VFTDTNSGNTKKKDQKMTRRRFTKRSTQERDLTNTNIHIPTEGLLFDRSRFIRPDPINDLRVFHPEGVYRRTFMDNLRRVETYRRLTHDNPRQKKYTDLTLDRDAFKNPNRVRVCQQRQERRRSLFATRKAGRGKKIRTKKHYNINSKTRC